MTDITAGDQATDLALLDLHPSLLDPVLTSMNQLNEIANRFPDAISFAPGRPYEGFLDLADVPRYLRAYQDHLTGQGHSPDQIRSRILQYGRTKGIIHDLIARQLAMEEGIEVDPESIVVTTGCQEAIFLVLRALRARPTDVLLAVSPTYVGLTGAALLVDLPVLPVAGGDEGIDLADLRAQLATAREQGLRPRACYVIPDFANPSGLSMPVALRRELLDLAADEDLLILEDNPYRLFDSGVPSPPTLKALDERRKVVQLGTFAKTGLPGARIGYVVADQRVAGAVEPLLADQLAKLKSMLTLNTSPIAQAVIGGKLLASEFSLRAANERERDAYRRNLRCLLAGLAARFGDGKAGVRWKAPGGGFFVVVSVPFTADDAALEYSAARHQVLWTPMLHFHSGAQAAGHLRLSCSALEPDEIDTGLDRFAALVADLAENPAAANRS